MSLCSRFALAVLGAVSVPVPGAAQDEDRFAVDLTGRASYDSNVARSDKALAVLRRIEPEDLLFTPSASFDIFKSISGFGVFLRGAAGYDFYKRNEHLNRERLDVNSGFRTQFNPCQGTFTGNYSRHQSDLLDITVVTETQNVEVAKAVAFDAICGRETGLKPTISLSETWSNNSASLLTTSESKTFSGTAGIDYNQPVLGDISVFGRYAKTDYPHRVVLVAGNPITDGFDLSTAGVKYSHRFGANIEVDLSPTFTSLRPSIPNATGFEGFAYQAGITVRPTSSLQAHFTFERAPKPVNRLDVTYSIQESYLVGTDYSFGTRWMLQLGGARTRNSFRGAALAKGLDIADEEINAIFGSISFALTNDLSVSVDSRSENRNANVALYNYNSFQAGLTIRARF